MKLLTRAKFTGILASLVVVMILASTFFVGTAQAAPTTITAYKSTIPVNISGPYQASQWTDTPTINEPISGVTFAVKQNGTGWLFLMIWQQSPGVCSDNACYGGIEIGPLTNTGAMGSTTTPTIMILGSPFFQGMVGHTVDEWISTGELTPTSVESEGYNTQSVCGALALSGTTYTVQCYRPFALKNASPNDFPTLGVGSTIELGFAVGEFNSPGTHDATSMSSYTLTISGSTYSSSSTTTTTTPTTTTTTTTTTTPTTTSTTTTSTTKTTTTTTTTPTTTTTTTTSTTQTTSTTTSTKSTTTTKPAYVVTVSTNANSYAGTTSGTISGTVTGHPSAGGSVELVITNPSNNAVFAQVVPFAGNGSFSGKFTPGAGWTVAGTYTLTASYSPDIYGPYVTYFTAASQFSYSSPVATSTTSTTSSTTSTPTTTTITQIVTATSTLTTLTQPVTTTLTQPVTTTLTQPVTTTATSTLTQPAITTVISSNTTTSTSVPSWAYGVMVLLLIVGLAVGYVVAGPRSRKSEVTTS